VAAAWRRERWAGNGGSEAVGAGMVAATAVQRRSARFGRHPGSEADARGPRGFVFSRIIQTGSNLKIENLCLTFLQKLAIFACGWIEIL
jgi:hypothetical protein